MLKPTGTAAARPPPASASMVAVHCPSGRRPVSAAGTNTLAWASPASKAWAASTTGGPTGGWTVTRTSAGTESRKVSATGADADAEAATVVAGPGATVVGGAAGAPGAAGGS